MDIMPATDLLMAWAVILMAQRIWHQWHDAVPYARPHGVHGWFILDHHCVSLTGQQGHEPAQKGHKWVTTASLTGGTTRYPFWRVKVWTNQWCEHSCTWNLYLHWISLLISCLFNSRKYGSEHWKSTMLQCCKNQSTSQECSETKQKILAHYLQYHSNCDSILTVTLHIHYI